MAGVEIVTLPVLVTVTDEEVDVPELIVPNACDAVLRTKAGLAIPVPLYAIFAEVPVADTVRAPDVVAEVVGA
jgi:hypothetical protein